MKSYLFSLSALALMALGLTINCYDETCGVYNYLGAPSFGYANANIQDNASGSGYEVGQENIGGVGGYNEGGGGGAENNESGGGGGGSAGNNGGDDSGYLGGGGGTSNNGDGAAGYQGYNGGGGAEYNEGSDSAGNNGGGGSGYLGGGDGTGNNGVSAAGHQRYGGGGGGYNGGGGYKHPSRNNYCPNCYIQNFGNGDHSENIISFKRHRN